MSAPRNDQLWISIFPSFMLNRVMPNIFKTLYIFYIAIIFAASVHSFGLSTVSLDDIHQITLNSCIFAAVEPVSPDLNEIFIKLQVIFKDEPNVFIGSLGSGSDKFIKWRDAEKKNNIFPKDIAVFEKHKIDRTCLLEPDSDLQAKLPIADFYDGPHLSEYITEFINGLCGTFRKSNGDLSTAGINRNNILSNLFHPIDKNDMTMGKLYSTLNNPLNQSYFYIPTCSSETEDQMLCTKLSRPTEKISNVPNYYVQTHIPTCETISHIPSKEEFFNKYLQHSKPVIFKGALKGWPAFKKWTNEFLRTEYGENEVHIKLSPGGDYEGVEKADKWENYKTFKIPEAVKRKLLYPDLVVVRPATMNLKFSEFLDLIEYVTQQKHGNISGYLEYSSIPQYMPGLEKDLEEFSFASQLLKRKYLNLWLSDGNTLGRLHFDPYDNLLCQVSGKKQVILFDPHNNKNLYEAHIPEGMLAYNHKLKQFRRKRLEDSTSMVMSPIDLLNPDFARFPNFLNAHPLNCTIDEGDVLFMPSFWWHEVKSFPNVEEKRNLAVNYWYEPFLTKDFPCPECKLDINPTYYHLL